VNVNLRPYYAEGSKSMCFEICEQLGWRIPRHTVIPMASGSLLTKIHKAYTEFTKLGLVDDARWEAFCRKRDAIERETSRLQRTWVGPTRLFQQNQSSIGGHLIEREHSLLDLLRRPGVVFEDIAPWRTDGAIAPEVAEQVEIAAKYAGYIERQQDEVARQLAQESVELPADLDYASVRGLSREVQQKLSEHRPQTIGQAARMQGVTPAAISLLLVHLKRHAPAQAREKHA